MLERCWRDARRDAGEMLGEMLGELLGEMLERCWRAAGEMLERCWRAAREGVEKLTVSRHPDLFSCQQCSGCKRCFFPGTQVHILRFPPPPPPPPPELVDLIPFECFVVFLCGTWD